MLPNKKLSQAMRYLQTASATQALSPETTDAVGNKSLDMSEFSSEEVMLYLLDVLMKRTEKIEKKLEDIEQVLTIVTDALETNNYEPL